MPRLYIYFAILVIVIGLIKWYSSNQYDAGYNAHKAEVADIKDDADTKGQKDVGILIGARKDKKEEVRVKIKKIYIKADPTNCRSTKLIDMGISLQ